MKQSRRLPKDAGIEITLVGRGRWMSNVFIERLCPSLEYKLLYLHAIATGSRLRVGPMRLISYYNANRSCGPDPGEGF